MKNKLPKGYLVKEMPREEFWKLFEKQAPKVFRDNLDYDPDHIDSESTQKKFKALEKQFASPARYRIYLGVFKNNKFVGWSWGYQYTATTFYMCNSAVLPAHRRLGIYTYLMNEVVRRASSAGFMSIFSRHIMTNNDIIISKLKMGFKITNFELSERFGNLVHLTYFPQKIHNDILDFRSGYKRPDKKLKKLFKL